MRIVFMGSAAMACPCLARMLDAQAYHVAGVVTQPDRPRGRLRKSGACPVGAFVKNMEIPVLTPDNVNTDESLRRISNLQPDIIVVVAYGQILKLPVLEMPGGGCINVHGSLLPRYRGAAPVERAIANGEKMTGVTTIFMNAAMDAGDIIAQLQEPIYDEDTAGSLGKRLELKGADLLISTLDKVRLGTARGIKQSHVDATYAPKLKKSDGRLDWTRTAIEINNKVRGFNPRPGCFFERSAGGSVRVFKTRVEHMPDQAVNIRQSIPGCVLETSGDGPLVQTGDMAVRLTEVQPEGRNIMSGVSFLCGYSLKVGEVLMSDCRLK